MKKIQGVVLILAFILILPPAGSAASPWTKESGYWNKVQEKAHFGLTNMCLGWLDPVSESEQATNDKKNAYSAFGKGCLHAPILMIGGVLHVITAPITQLDIPLPHDGVNV